MNEELIKAIESMQRHDPDGEGSEFWLGEFSASFEFTDGGTAIEWPNLIIAKDRVKELLTTTEKTMVAHWHEQNPWKDQLIYITVEELIGLTEEDGVMIQHQGQRVPYMRYWFSQYGDKLDAYLLPSGSLGLRFGPEGADYLSFSVFQSRVIGFLVERAKKGPF